MVAVWHQGCVNSERSNLLFVISMLEKLWLATRMNGPQILELWLNITSSQHSRTYQCEVAPISCAARGVEPEHEAIAGPVAG